MSRKLSFFQKTIFLFNLGVGFALLLAYSAPYINPSLFWLPAFIGLGYPVLLVLNMGFVLIWALQKKLAAIFSLICILLGWNFLGLIFAVNLSGSGSAEEAGIRVMTYNVKSFDLYNWSNNIESKTKIIELIQGENPVIACFQEFYTEDKGELNNLGRLRKQLPGANYHFEKTVSLNGKEHWGLATFSKYPIVGKGKQAFPDSYLNNCIYTDIDINGEIFRVYNVHLQSIHFRKEDYDFLSDISVETSSDRSSLKAILGRLKSAFIKRSEQAVLVASHIEQSPYPVIVCGDFNDSPVSFAYHTISKGLQDAFVQAGWGIGQTYSGPFPAFRIDHILFSKGIRAKNYKTIRKSYSDHYPVSVSLLF